ncbi:putative mitogen-activated protein kinase kinase kinase STE-STE11 family [Arabidopsis thaliana]
MVALPLWHYLIVFSFIFLWEIALLSQLQHHYIMSFSSSSVGSESTCSLMTPSMEFPDRISFRKRDFSEEGPSGRVKEKINLMCNKLIENFRKPEDMVLITSWLKGQLLGRGSFASVYEAISEDGDFFAVKEVSLLDQGIQAQECIQQLEGEIALLSQLQHQNIVRYRGTAKDVSKLYIFLELVTQGSVQKLYERYQLSYTVVSLYTRQILAGLNYLHDKGFVHRDIKCANMLVDANGTVKLADFGLAEVINRKDSDGNGSPADIWSLGCTVLEMCTGQIPYSDLKPIQAAFKIGRGTLPDVPDTLSLDARHFILTCLKLNPEERPTAAELLNHPFVRRPLPSSGSGSTSPLIRR